MATKPVPFGWQPLAITEGESHIVAFRQERPGVVRSDLTLEEIARTIQTGSSRIWVDVDSQHHPQWLALAETIGFHPLTIEDTLSRESRIKIEEYEDCLFAVARDATFASSTPDPYDFETCNLYMYLGKTFLVTVHERPSRATKALADRVRGGAELFDRGMDYLAYGVLDSLIDLYFPMLDQVDEFVDQLEVGIFERASNEVLEQIFALKRTLLALRRHHAPMREMLASLANRPSPYLQPATQIYFRDVYDHVVRQVESIETYRDLLSGALEIYFSVQSNRMNEIMKALTVVGTFLLPATWIASIYGMNFEWMPFLHHRMGFWVAMLIMFSISGGLMGYIKHKGWM